MLLHPSGCCTYGKVNGQIGGGKIVRGVLSVISCAVSVVVLGGVDKVPWWGHAVGWLLPAT